MKRKMMYVLGTFILCLMITPNVAKAWEGSGGGGGTNLQDCSSGWCFDFRYTSEQDQVVAGAEGLRLTVVDKKGNKVQGTRSYDYFRTATYNAVMDSEYTGGQVYYNQGKANNGNKGAVHTHSAFFVKGRYPYAGQWNGIPHIITANAQSFNTQTLNFIKNYVNSNPNGFMNMLKNDLQYDMSKDTGLGERYLQFEPLMAVYHGSAANTYVGTATEIMTLLKSKIGRLPNLEAYGLAWGILVDCNVAVHLSDASGMNKRNFTYPYIAPGMFEAITGAKTDPFDTYFSNDGKNAYGHGVLWLTELFPCDWNNPDHFKDTNGDGIPDSGPGGANCCVSPSITASHSKEEIEFAYPICGSCDVNTQPPQANTPACGTDGSSKNHTFTDTVSWRCMYLDKDRTQMYKVSSINKYCSVYCKESTSLLLPGSYQGYVMTGSSFIWPNSSKYRLDISGTRECKVKVDYKTWYDEYKDAAASTKASLEQQMKNCASDNVLNTRQFAYDLQPTIKLSGYKGYRNGKDEDDSTVGSVELTAKKQPIELTQYSIKYSGSVAEFSTSSTGIQKFAETLWDNKSYVATTQNQYVLPNDLYSYANKKTGILSYRKPNSDKIDHYTNRGYGSLAVDDSTIPSGSNEKKENTVTLSYKKISANNDETHFDRYTKDYTCQYNVKRGNVTVCDYQNPEHFKDIDGDGLPDSGPNGEDCCNHFITEFEGDTEKIEELKNKYPICKNTNAKCDYKNPSQYIGAPYGTTPGKGPNGQNCCDDLKANYVKYGLTYQQFKQLEQKYQCSGGNGTCTPIPTVYDKSCCSDPKYQNYPVCKMEGGINVLYREISLSHPFLSEDGKTRTPGDNWNSKNNYLVSKYITNNRDVKEEDIYTEKPMYIFELNSQTISAIRSYNRGHKFDDFELKCKDGRDCQSRFIESYLTDTGSTCTTNRGHNISRCNKD